MHLLPSPQSFCFVYRVTAVSVVYYCALYLSSPNPILDEHFRLFLKQYWLNYRKAVVLQSEQWMEVKRGQCKVIQKHSRFIERSVDWMTNVIAFYTTFAKKFSTLLHSHSFKLNSSSALFHFFELNTTSQQGFKLLNNVIATKGWPRRNRKNLVLKSHTWVEKTAKIQLLIQFNDASNVRPYNNQTQAHKKSNSTGTVSFIWFHPKRTKPKNPKLKQRCQLNK